MPQQQNKNKNRGPGQSFDMKPVNDARNKDFPGVGMTLNTYASNNAKTRARQPTASPQPKGRFARFRSKITRKRIMLCIVVIILLAVGWLGWKLAYNAQRLFGGNVFSALTSSKLQGEDVGRVNILLAGNSADDVGHDGGSLTDSIMIMSVDTKNKTAFMMSVPRDLYVRIPDVGSGKINAVYPNGERQAFSENGYAKGGMGLLQKVIERDLGIRCDYYALVNYNALREAVNSVGGISFNVESSDKRGLYDPSKDYVTNGPLVKLTNGVHTLNGQQALNLARARGDARGSYGFANSDFDRTENQRKLILALRSKATSAGVLTNPIKLGKLFDAAGNNVETNFTLSDVRRLYDVTKGIGGSAITSVGLNDADGQNLLANYRTPRNESALVPAAGTYDYSDIQRYIQRLTSTNLVVRENAETVVLNGTTTSGIAAKEQAALETKNIRVSLIADADTEDYATTRIIDLSGGAKPATLKALQKRYAGSTITTTDTFAGKYDVDFIIIAGADRIPTDTQ